MRGKSNFWLSTRYYRHNSGNVSPTHETGLYVGTKGFMSFEDCFLTKGTLVKLDSLSKEIQASLICRPIVIIPKSDYELKKVVDGQKNTCYKQNSNNES